MPADVMQAESATYNPTVFSLSGRLGRLRYFMYGTLLALLGAGVLIAVLGTFLLNPRQLNGFQIGVIGLDYLFLIVSTFVLARRRLNDLDKSGWFTTLFLVPLANLVVTFWLLFKPGTKGPNSFGPAPSANPPGLIKAAWALVALYVGLFALALIAPLSRVAS